MKSATTHPVVLRLQATFQRLQEETKAMQAFGASGLVVRIRLEGDDQEILVDGRLQEVFWDPRPGRADLELHLPADLLHRILMEEASFRKSFMNGDIRSQGNVFSGDALCRPAPGGAVDISGPEYPGPLTGSLSL